MLSSEGVFMSVDKHRILNNSVFSKRRTFTYGIQVTFIQKKFPMEGINVLNSIHNKVDAKNQKIKRQCKGIIIFSLNSIAKRHQKSSKIAISSV